MKKKIKLIALCFVLLTITNLKAQQSVLIKSDTSKKVQTLFPGKIKSIGFSSSAIFLFGPIGNQIGYSFAYHLNNKWEIGGTFTETTQQKKDNNILCAPNTAQQFNALSISFTPNANSLLHLSFPLLIGEIRTQNESGPIAIMLPNPQNGLPANPIIGGQGGIQRGHDLWGGPKALGIQPGVLLELNLFQYIRIFTNANYRLALGDYSTDAMRGFVGSAGIKAGIFDYKLRSKKKR